MSARREYGFAAVMLLAVIPALVQCAGGVVLAHAGEVKVAVASNFLKPLEQLAKSFKNTSGHSVIISAGSTGKLYAQIVRGAPFEVFLAANAREPERLEKEGAAISGSRFTYALGRLTLWSSNPGTDPKAALTHRKYNRIALANPKLAPYGEAAMVVLEHLGVTGSAKDKLITGENVSQVHQFASAGNVDFGFIAFSQVATLKGDKAGSVWIISASLYDPIRQQAVLLMQGEHNPVASEFLTFLQSKAAKEKISKFGYGVEP